MQKFWRWLTHEIEVVGAISLYFLSWFGLLVVLKQLMLAQYEIAFSGVSIAIISALIVAKVVLVMEKIPLGTERYPAAVDVVVRTLLYVAGVFVVSLLERVMHVRHEAGGFWAGLAWVFAHREIHHVLAQTICVGAAMLTFNTHSIVRRAMGQRALARLFFVTPLEKVEAPRAGKSSVSRR